ncbi:PQQ-dependent sugar dehydrogenase [Aquibium sp. A9E412]|uniref:PQQ-dependent sugar dehydrogenase n=1 Tax=Aquibium sp. A9E412 TaxID=2976767 RepID=UPI0025B1322F|nr:PQQ-dependent sugar dehydrogenase [Aquibium sp. A9E412]MDN2568424.1 PQQ-dependent sugar dehydrogenase [Aquibium sp. A9E412]
MRIAAVTLAALALPTVPAAAQSSFTVESNERTLSATPVAAFQEPWAMTFLPDGALLVTEKPGTLQLVTQDGEKTAVSGVPEVAYGGQGGLGDVVPHPDFVENDVVYLSYAEPGEGGTRGAAVARATLARGDGSPALENLEVVWRQQPKVSGSGHYSHRLAFAPDGEALFITSGDRQKQTPAQDMQQALGKIIRLDPDGSVPDDNPFQDAGELARSFWSVGHRNMLGIAFDAEDRLWAIEMGPRGGDEINLIEAGENYGWPVVSNGRNYSGADIPDHATRPEFAAPEASWTPVISPAGLVIYSGDMFADWQGNALTGGLSSRALVRIDLGEQDDGTMAAEIERFDMGARIREVEQGPAGAVWVLEDGDGGRLLRLTPAGAG